jgi:hypothetical protein
LDLLVFLQSWIVPISGLPGDLVRPRWQPEPANIPSAGTAWMAMGVTPERSADTFPFVEESADGLTSRLQRQEELPILCSFYDLGSTGDADRLASLLRDNLAIRQNSEPLRAGGFALAYVGSLTPVPSLLSTRWLYRIDLPVVVRRQIDRDYSVLSVTSLTGEVDTSDGYNFPISTGP